MHGCCFCINIRLYEKLRILHNNNINSPKQDFMFKCRGLEEGKKKVWCISPEGGTVVSDVAL